MIAAKGMENMKQKTTLVAKPLKKYPVYCCTDCAEAAGGVLCKSMSTWHYAVCSICGKNKPVTEPRDFGYPVFDGFKRP